MRAGKGLTGVPTAELQRLLRSLHRGHLSVPVTRSGLIAAAFGDIEAGLDLLIGRDRASAQALLVAVIAERREFERRLQR